MLTNSTILQPYKTMPNAFTIRNTDMIMREESYSYAGRVHNTSPGYWEGNSYLTSEEVVLFVLVNVLMPESSSLSFPLQLSVEWKTHAVGCLLTLHLEEVVC